MDVSIKNLSKGFKNNVQALNDFSLDIKQGEFVVVLGESGSGKSTLLKLMCALDYPTSGGVYYDGKEIDDALVRENRVAMVFQSYALYPQLTAYQNIALPLKQNVFYRHLTNKKGQLLYRVDKTKVRELKKELKFAKKAKNQSQYKIYKSQISELIKNPSIPVFGYKGYSKREIDEKINDIVVFLEITPYLHQRADSLSGGQKQRVALARAMAKQPNLLLMDEPLSNLDIKLKNQARLLIRDVQRKLGCPTVLVTHDQADAKALADKVVILKDGIIQQNGTFCEILNRPNNIFVSQIISNPKINLITGKYSNGSIQLSDKINLKLPKEKIDLLSNYENQELVVGIRPIDIKDNENGEFELDAIRSELLGRNSYVHFSLNDEDFIYKSEKQINIKQPVSVDINVDNILLFDKNTENIIL